MKYFIVLSLLLVLYSIGILIFTKGFLLKRIVVTRNSSCSSSYDDVGNVFKKTDDELVGCWLQPSFKKAIIIIVDALRFDFVSYDGGKPSGDTPYFSNKLTVLEKTAAERPGNARLYRFIADPPTTTLQRLKGMTTGSLPTFVDAGANFASVEISEDNIIDQLVSLNKNITFAGDDTWQSLFPRRFAKAFSFHSFNTKDLDTVDTGVSKHLIREMQLNDWDILIGHFLGVDHCGHTFGPNHPAMAKKLLEMNSEMSSIMNAMDNDTILFILGDHGMTAFGDHGGDSEEELTAALFVFSPRSLSESSVPVNIHSNVVSQVDLVPTIALLLGAPIPFSNLGTIVVDLFNISLPIESASINKHVSSAHRFVQAAQVNAHQVKRYISEYVKLSDELPRSELSMLEALLSSADSELQQLLTATSNKMDPLELASRLEELRSKYTKYVVSVRSLCQSVWSKFDLVTMALGCSVLLSGLIINVALLTARSVSTKTVVSVASYVSGILVLMTAYLFDSFLSFEKQHFKVFFFCSIIFGPIVAIVTVRKSLRLIVISADLFAVVLYAFYVVSLHSNSFVVYESSVLLFCAQSLMLILFLSVVLQPALVDSAPVFTARRGASISSRVARVSRANVPVILFLIVVSSMCLRLSASFHMCREEQVDCGISPFAQPLSAVVSNIAWFKTLRFIVSAFSIISVSFAVFRWLRHQGNMNGSAYSVLMMYYVIPLAVIVVCFYWMVDGLLPHTDRRFFAPVLVALPRLVYVLSSIVLIVSVVSPLCIYVIPKQDETDGLPRRLQDLPYLGADGVVPQIYNHIRYNWKSLLTTSMSSPSTPRSNTTPIVFGLATVYSSSLLVPLVAVFITIAMLLGDNMAPGAALFFPTMFGVLELHSYRSQMMHRAGHRSLLDVSFTTIVLFAFVASESFFSSGHQTTIVGIRWEAAFHGFIGNHSTIWLPALLILINMFGTELLSTLSLPLLIYWPFTRGRRSVKNVDGDNPVEDVEDKGEFVLNEDEGSQLKHGLYRLLVKFTLLNASKVFATVLCASLQRRHLMVWKIFAPRFVYCCASFFVTSAASLLVYLFAVRVNRAVAKWVDALCKETA